MARLIRAKTANDLWCRAKMLINAKGKFINSRCGSTVENLHILLELENPVEKWVYKRNPPISIGFALAELMWIVNGSQETKIIDFWNPNLKNFSADKGSNIYHGAYGYRLKFKHSLDQLKRAYQALHKNPNNRQTVMLIWKPDIDLPDKNGKPISNDIPCNICSLLKIRDGYLDWTQILRSNDLFLGLPYNLVQFTSLQEIMAGWLKVKVGSYNHYSDSLHIYDTYKPKIGYLPKIEVLVNTDRLSIPKADFDKISERIFDRMKCMVNLTKPTEEKIRCLATLESKYEAYNNILYIIGAYAANKFELKILAEELVKKCSNKIYTFIWHKWVSKQQ
jgi:thymidylate synthase